MPALLTDQHSLDEYRIWDVRNSDVWRRELSPNQTDKMYLKVDDRLKIW